MSADFRTAWRCLAASREQYVLRYESKYMKEMGQGMQYLSSFAINAAAQEALKMTILQGTSIIPFSIICEPNISINS